MIKINSKESVVALLCIIVILWMHFQSVLSGLLTQKEIKLACAVFTALDTDKDGLVYQSDLKVGVFGNTQSNTTSHSLLLVQQP